MVREKKFSSKIVRSEEWRQERKENNLKLKAIQNELKDYCEKEEFPDPRKKIKDPKLLKAVNDFLRDVGTDPDNISFTDCSCSLTGPVYHYDMKATNLCDCVTSLNPPESGLAAKSTDYIFTTPPIMQKKIKRVETKKEIIVIDIDAPENESYEVVLEEAENLQDTQQIMWLEDTQRIDSISLDANDHDMEIKAEYCSENGFGKDVGHSFVEPLPPQKDPLAEEVLLECDEVIEDEESRKDTSIGNTCAA